MDHFEVNVLSGGKRYNTIMAASDVQNNDTLVIDKLPHNSEYFATIMVLDKNDNNLTENVHIEGRTKSPTLSLR